MGGPVLAALWLFVFVATARGQDVINIILPDRWVEDELTLKEQDCKKMSSCGADSRYPILCSCTATGPLVNVNTSTGAFRPDGGIVDGWTLADTVRARLDSRGSGTEYTPVEPSSPSHLDSYVIHCPGYAVRDILGDAKRQHRAD